MCIVKIPPIFSKGMVLQRNKHMPLHGEICIPSNGALPGSVCACIAGVEVEAPVNKNGTFLLSLPALPPGGPYTLTITGIEPIEDVWIGDLYLLSGQSNMELPVSRVLDVSGEEVAQTVLPEVRQFHIPSRYAFDKPIEKMPEGVQWEICNQEHIMEFSAIGLFFAKEMQAFHHIPIGLVSVAVGGSTLEAWLPLSETERLPERHETIKDYSDINHMHALIKHQEGAADAWRESIIDDEVKFSAIPENPFVVQVPSMIKEYGLHNYSGSLFFYKTIDLPHVGEAPYIYLGAIIDSDKVYINGELIGATAYRYPPRKYTIPKGVLKKGENLIALRIEINSGNGGFVPDMPYYLFDGIQRHTLKGEWYMAGGNQALQPCPLVLFPPLLPSGLYNGILYALKDVPFQGVLWYQGESNIGRAKDYAMHFQVLVHAWRDLFGYQIPFFCVQLSSYMDALASEDGGGFALLRDSQRRCLAINKVYCIPAMDAGQRHDIHPQFKKPIGIRLAHAVQTELFHKETHYHMPVPRKAYRREKNIIIEFEHLNVGMKIPVRGIEVIASDGMIMKADAYMYDNQVIVLWHGDTAALRYAWQDVPLYMDIRNEYGVISGSFYIYTE